MDYGIIRFLKAKYFTNLFKRWSMLSAVTNLCLQFQSLKPWKCLCSYGMMCLPQKCKTTSKNLEFLWRQKDSDSDDQFSSLKHSIKQLQSREKGLVPDDATCDNILTFDDEVSELTELLQEQNKLFDRRKQIKNYNYRNACGKSK